MVTWNCYSPQYRDIMHPPEPGLILPKHSTSLINPSVCFAPKNARYRQMLKENENNRR